MAASPALKSWLPIPPDSDFSMHNLPLGIITSRNSREVRRPAMAIGTHVIDLQAFSAAGGLSLFEIPNSTPVSAINVFREPTLNAFAALGQPFHREFRTYMQDLLREDTTEPGKLRDDKELREKCVLKMEDVKLHLPMVIGDYTDFFAGVNHARNAGTIFRGPQNALQPNYHHLPVGYHGRASSVVISGTPITRPNGQILPTPESKTPIFAPSRKLDFELEFACFLCKGNELGEPIKIENAGQHIFGYTLMNDWSARDIQAWEYVPLGPFCGKSFGTSVGGWVVLYDALEEFRTEQIKSEAEVLPYLRDEKRGDEGVFDINLEVDLVIPDGSGVNGEGTANTIVKTNAKELMWSFEQMIAHQSAGGCRMRVGDLLGSGTITGVGEQEMGSLLEKTVNGKKEMMLSGMEVRTWLRDGDEVVIRGCAGGGKVGDGQLEGQGNRRVGFGECRGRVRGAPGGF